MPRTATQSKKKSIYSVHPGVLMTQKWIGELKQKTGRSLEECVFVDDVDVNCETARALGMHAVQFESAQQAIPAVERLLGA